MFPLSESYLSENLLPFLDPSSPLPKDSESILKDILQLLLKDGLKYSASSEQKHYLRRLGEAASGGTSTTYAENIILVLICLICAALASGLTQGLLSLDLMEMTIKARSGTQKERIYASMVIPVITRHHLLLVTLMLWNAVANEALPVFLQKLVPEWLAIVLSVTMVLFVGEIIPAAVLTGPNQLMIAAKLLPLVYAVMGVFFLIAYPISLALDFWLGHDEGLTMYNRKEITTMMKIQHEVGVRKGRSRRDTVQQEEVQIVGGALKFSDMYVRDVMTPSDKVFMLASSERLTYKTLSEIFKSGYSRIPVYGVDRNDIVGLILTKDLIFVDPEDETSIENFVRLFGRKPSLVWHDQTLGDTLSMFRRSRSHMAIVRDVNNFGPGDPFYELIGIITLEDIIEEILGTEIEDETDFSTEIPRDMDFARLKLMNAKMADAHLSAEEVRAVAAHLMTNVPQIQSIFGDDKDAVFELVHLSAVLDLKRAASDPHKPLQEDFLYRKGKMSNSCLLVLNGKVGVLAGKDQFLSEMGPWTTIAADALISSDGSYIPDYTAYVSSDSVRALRLSVHSSDVANIVALRKRKEELGILSTITATTAHSRHERRVNRMERRHHRERARLTDSSNNDGEDGLLTGTGDSPIRRGSSGFGQSDDEYAAERGRRHSYNHSHSAAAFSSNIDNDDEGHDRGDSGGKAAADLSAVKYLLHSDTDAEEDGFSASDCDSQSGGERLSDHRISGQSKSGSGLLPTSADHDVRSKGTTLTSHHQHSSHHTAGYSKVSSSAVTSDFPRRHSSEAIAETSVSTSATPSAAASVAGAGAGAADAGVRSPIHRSASSDKNYSVSFASLPSSSSGAPDSTSNASTDTAAEVKDKQKKSNNPSVDATMSPLHS